MLSVVIGGAGFIGVNVIRRLLGEGAEVVAADNFVRGSRALMAELLLDPRLHFIEADVAVAQACSDVFELAARLGPVDEVWHLAANSDIAAGAEDADIDLKDTFLTTFHLVRRMRAHGVRKVFFSSSSAIYGDLNDVPLTEDIGPLLPISNYGAMKLASEAFIAASVAELDQALLFRFANIVGVPATHGVVLDFVRRLRVDPATLTVLGDGTQRKPYLHVSDLVDGMFFARARAPGGVSAYNIGPPDEGVAVRWIAEQVVSRCSPGASLEYGHGPRGWVGDVPRFRYSTARMTALGWRPSMDSAKALIRAIDEIMVQEGG